jgi:hypothetical protein
VLVFLQSLPTSPSSPQSQPCGRRERGSHRTNLATAEGERIGSGSGCCQAITPTAALWLWCQVAWGFNRTTCLGNGFWQSPNVWSGTPLGSATPWCMCILRNDLDSTSAPLVWSERSGAASGECKKSAGTRRPTYPYSGRPFGS